MSWTPNVNVNFGNNYTDPYPYYNTGNVVSQKISGLIVGICFCVIGVIVMILDYYQKKNTKKVTGVVLSSDCITTINNSHNRGFTSNTNCNLEVEYTVDGKKYKSNLVSSDRYVKGQSINMLYKTTNPNEIMQYSKYQKYIAGVLICIGIFVLFTSLYFFIRA